MTGRDVAALVVSAVAGVVACAVGISLWGIDRAINKVNEALHPDELIDLTRYEAHAWPSEDITHRDGLAWHNQN
jgi:hypothetical protein